MLVAYFSFGKPYNSYRLYNSQQNISFYIEIHFISSQFISKTIVSPNCFEQCRKLEKQTLPCRRGKSYFRRLLKINILTEMEKQNYET